MTQTFFWSRRAVVVLVPLLALLLLGAGCTTATIPEEEASGVQSSFDGLDGSLTEFAFDEIGTAYGEWLLIEPVTEEPTAEDFAEWIAGEEDLPVNDTFSNPVKLRSDAPRSFVLWTEGEDREPGTADDYYKTFSY